MAETKKLIEFLDDIIKYCKKQNDAPMVSLDNEDLAMFTEIKGIVEQQEIKQIKISKSQGEQIMKKVKDFDAGKPQPDKQCAVHDDLEGKIYELVLLYRRSGDYINAPKVKEEIHNLFQESK